MSKLVSSPPVAGVVSESESLESVSIVDRIRDCFENGKPRLSAVKSWVDIYWGNGVGIPEILTLYQVWVSFVEYVVLKKEVFDKKTGLLNDVVYKGVKARKRGNDVHRWSISKKLCFIDELSGEDLFSVASRNMWSQALFITLTYDPNRCGLMEAWSNIGDEFNGWVSAVKRRFGNFRFFRVWESFGKKGSSAYGYPHIHIVAVFKEHRFSVFRHRNKKGGFSFRVHSKHKFADIWHSHVDVKGIRNIKRSIGYLSKYMTKSFSDVSKKHSQDLTNALCWIFKKRSYSVSGEFADLILSLRNSNRDWGVLHQYSLFGVDLESDFVVKWSFVGVMSASELGCDGSEWVVDVDKE